MTVLNAIILGLIHGIAEFVPVSGSGHLSVICNLFALSSTDGIHSFYDALLNFGTAFSVCIVFWKEITEMFTGIFAIAGSSRSLIASRENYASARSLILIMVSVIPLLIVVPVKSYIDRLYGNNMFVGVMFLLSGCVLYVADKFSGNNKTEKNMSLLDALLIGICQCVATIPGISRTAITITAGKAAGLKQENAVNYSLILTAPAFIGAGVIAISRAFRIGVDLSALPAYLIGLAVSIISGIIVLSVLKKISAGIRFYGLSYYCFIAGALSIILTIIF